MDTLLLRLIAPMQSWGVQSQYTVRDTGLEPSKSGVIGLLCAALGRPRDKPVDDLASLRMGVRVDREGTMRRDYHIVQKVLDSNGKNFHDSVVTNRYYLADAAFLVGFEGERLLLQELNEALKNPVWAIYLGRKAFIPSCPVWMHDSLREDQPLEQAFGQYGWIVRWREGTAPKEVRAILDNPDGSLAKTDVPISFAERRFSSRRVSVKFLPAPASISEEVI